jgi:hypothetical protein
MRLLLADPDLPERAAYHMHHRSGPAALHLSRRGSAKMAAAAPTTSMSTRCSSWGSSCYTAFWGSCWPRRRGAGFDPLLQLHHFFDAIRSLGLVGLL